MKNCFILYFAFLLINSVLSGHIFSQPTEIQPQNHKYASRFHIFFSVETPLIAGDFLIIKFPFKIGIFVTAQLSTNLDVSSSVLGFLTRVSGKDPEHYFVITTPIPVGVWHRLLIKADPTSLSAQTFGPQGCINLQTASDDSNDRIIYDSNSCLDYISLGPEVDSSIFKVYGQYSYTQQTAITSFGQMYTAFFDVFPNEIISEGAIITLTIAGNDFSFGFCQSVSCLIGSTDPDCPSRTYNINEVLGSCSTNGQTLTFTLTQDVSLNPFRIRTSIVNPNTVATSSITAVYKSKKTETWFASVTVQPNYSLNPLVLITNYPIIQASSTVLLFWGLAHEVVSSSGFIGCPIYLYRTGATIPIFNSIRTIVSISTTINSFRALKYLNIVWYPAEISSGVTILMSSVRSTFPVVSVSGIKSFCSLAGNGVNCTFIDTLNSGNSYTISGKMIISYFVVATSATCGKVEFYRGDSTSNKIGTSTAPSIAIKLNKEYLDATSKGGIISTSAYVTSDTAAGPVPLTTDAKLALTAMDSRSRLQTSSYNVFHSYLNPLGTIKYKLDVADSGLNTEHVLAGTIAALYDNIIADFYDFGRSGVFLRPSTSAESENWGLLMMLSTNVPAEICQDLALSLAVLVNTPLAANCWYVTQTDRVYVMLKIIFNNNVLNINSADFSAGVLIVGTMFSVRGDDKYKANGFVDVVANLVGTIDLSNVDMTKGSIGSFRTKTSIVNYGGTNPFTYNQNFISSTGNFWYVTIICNPLAASTVPAMTDVSKSINCGTIGQSSKATTNFGAHSISGIAFQKTNINIYPSQYADTYVFDFLQCFKCIKKSANGGWDGTSPFNENNWILTENPVAVDGFTAGTAVFNSYVIQGVSSTPANNYKSTASFVNYYYDNVGKTFGPGVSFASYIRVHAILGTSLTTSGTQISIFIDGSPTTSTETGATYATLKSYASNFREVSVVDHNAGASTMATVFQGYDETAPRMYESGYNRYLNDLWISKSGFTYNSNIGTTNAEVNVYIPVIGRIISLDSLNIAVLGTPNIETGVSPIIGVFRVFGSWYKSSLKMSPRYPSINFFPSSTWPDYIIGTNTLFWPPTDYSHCVGAAPVTIKTQIKSTSSSSDLLPSKTYSHSVAFSGQISGASAMTCKINLGNNLVSSFDETTDLSANGDVPANWPNSKTIGSAFIIYSRDNLYNIFNPTTPLTWFGGPNNKCIFHNIKFCTYSCSNIYTILCQADKIHSDTDANYGADSSLVRIESFTVPFYWGLNYNIADKLQYVWSNLVGQGVYVAKDSSQTTDWIYKTCIANQINGIPQNTRDVSYSLVLTNAITYILEANDVLVISQEFTSSISTTAINFAFCEFPLSNLVSCTNILSQFTLKNTDPFNKLSITNININVIVDTIGTTTNTHWAKVLFNGATTEYCSQANPVQFTVDGSKGLSDITFGSSIDFKYSNMKRARGTFFFTFSFAKIIRKNYVFTFDLGFFSNPTQSSKNFRCQILNSNGLVSSNFKSISTADLTKSYIRVKSTIISGGSFKYKCSGGQTTDYSTGTTNNIIASLGRIESSASPIASTINPISPGLAPPDSVSISSASLEKYFKNKGFDAEYVISFIPSVTNINSFGRIYVEFPLSIPPKLNYAGIIHCYLDEISVLFEFIDERRISISPNKELKMNNPIAYKLRISSVTQPNPVDVQENPEIYLALDTNDNSYDGISEQIFIADSFDTGFASPAIIYIHDLSYTVNRIKDITSISMILSLPDNSRILSGFLYVEFPASLDNLQFYNSIYSCSLKRLNDSTNTQFVSSCEVVRGRKVKLNLVSFSENYDNKNYNLTLSNILTPDLPSNVSRLFRETIRVFITPDNQIITYTTAAGNRNTSTYFNWMPFNCTKIIDCVTYAGNCTCESCTAPAMLNFNKTKCCLPIKDCLIYDYDCSCNSCIGTKTINLLKTKCCDSILQNCGMYGIDCNSCESCLAPSLFNSIKTKCCNPIFGCGILDENCLCLYCNAPAFRANPEKTKCCTTIINCGVYGTDCNCNSCKAPSVFNSDKSKCCTPIPNCENYQIDCACSSTTVLNCPSNCAKCHGNIYDQIICDECLEGYYYKEECIKQNFAMGFYDGMIIQLYNFFNMVCLTSENSYKNCNGAPTLDTLFKLNEIHTNKFTITALANLKNLYSKCYQKFNLNSLDYNYGNNYEFNSLCDNNITLSQCFQDFNESENAEICQRNYINLTSSWSFHSINNEFAFEHDKVSFLIKNNGLNNSCLFISDGFARLQECNEGDVRFNFGFNQIDNVKTENNIIKSEVIGLSDKVTLRWSNPKNISNIIYIVYYFDDFIDFNTYICGTDRVSSPITFTEYVNEIGSIIVETNVTLSDLKKCGVRMYEDENYLHFIMTLITYNNEIKIGYSDYYDLLFKKSVEQDQFVYVGNGTTNNSGSQIINNKNTSIYLDVSKALVINFTTLISNKYLQKNVSQSLTINYESSSKFTLNLTNNIIVFSSINKIIYINATYTNAIANEIVISFDLSTLPSNYYSLKLSLNFQFISRILAQNNETTKNFISNYEMPIQLFIGDQEEIEVKINESDSEGNLDNKELILIVTFSTLIGLILLTFVSICVFKKHYMKKIKKTEAKYKDPRSPTKLLVETKT